MVQQSLLKYGAILGGIGVILGALGAHALKSKLSPEALSSFETGVKYQLYHALFLLLLAAIDNGKNYTFLKTIGVLALMGVLLFSGSIYLLSTQNITHIDFKLLGPVTPLGGICLITAWFMLAYQSKNLLFK